MATAGAIITATIVLTGSLNQVGVVLFLTAWAVLGTGTHRCAEFSQVGNGSRLPIVALAIHGVVATAIIRFIWSFTMPILVIP